MRVINDDLCKKILKYFFESNFTLATVAHYGLTDVVKELNSVEKLDDFIKKSQKAEENKKEEA